MAGDGKKYRVFDVSNPIIKKQMRRVLDGVLSIAEGAKLANVNKECFRKAVNKEKARLAALEAEKEAGGDCDE